MLAIDLLMMGYTPKFLQNSIASPLKKGKVQNVLASIHLADFLHPAAFDCSVPDCGKR
jgi:hypothetical protein